MYKAGKKQKRGYPGPKWGMGDLESGPHLIHGSLDTRESVHNQHLNQSSRFCTAHPCAQHTDRQTHRPRYVRHL